jgi:RNA-binding protein
MTGKQRRRLRALAHDLHPIVQIGQRGLTEAVVQQVDAALVDHELIKVKLGRDSARDRVEAELTERTGAELAGRIGHVLILYRPHPERPRIQLTDDAERPDEEAPHGPL